MNTPLNAELIVLTMILSPFWQQYALKGGINRVNNDFKPIFDTKENLEKIYEYKTKGAILQSKTRRYNFST